MPTGTITTVHLSHADGSRCGFISCPGRPDLTFDEDDFETADGSPRTLTAADRGKRATFNECGDHAERVRLVE
jgi:hypothetical protein